MIGTMMTDEMNKNFFKVLGQIQNKILCWFVQSLTL
jgi:hypothetical protein